MTRRRLTPKQKRFISEYLATGGNATQAALAAYNTNYATAKSIGAENLAKPYLRAEIERAFHRAKVTPDRVAKTLSRALDARTESGSDDHPVRLRAVDLVAKLGAWYPEPATMQSSEVRHQHTHAHALLILKDQPIEVIRFVAAAGRLPTDEERQQILAGSEASGH